MSIETEIGFEPKTAKLDRELSTLNKKLRQLGLSELPRLPEIPEGVNLSQYHIAWVEDSIDAIQIQLPYYTAATEGKMDVVFKTTETIEEIADRVVSVHPEFVLVDGNLGDFYGADLVPLILQRDPKIKCIGYSADSGAGDVAREFRAKGAIGAVQKMGVPSEVIKNVSKFINQYSSLN